MAYKRAIRIRDGIRIGFAALAICAVVGGLTFVVSRALGFDPVHLAKSGAAENDPRTTVLFLLPFTMLFGFVYMTVWLRYRRDRKLAVFWTVVVAVAAWWGGPALWHIVSPGLWPDLDGLKDPADRAATIGQFRLAAIQACAATGGVFALLYTARNYRLIRRGQVTDRLTKALERLESDEEFGRLGGILALDQIIRDAPEQAEQVAQILRTFIRRKTPRKGASDLGPV